VPVVTVSPSTTNPGTSVDVLGSGFARNIKVTIAVDGGFTNFILRAKRDGTFGCGVLVGPQSTIGTHTIDVFEYSADTTGATPLASTTFKVEAVQPEPDPDPVPDPDPEPVPDPTPTPTGAFIIMDKAKFMALPTSGTAWDALKTQAAVSVTKADLSNQDDKGDTTILAKALVAARTGDTTLKNQVISALRATMGTELPGDALGMVRELGAVCLAADLVGYRADDFVAWIKKLQTWPNPDRGFTPKRVQDERPNNWGGHGGFARMCQSLYLGDQTDFQLAVKTFRGWLGDRSQYANFKFTSPMSWHSDPTKPIGINPKGGKYDGYIPDDARRGGEPPTITGAGIDYTWEALMGYVMQAVILERYGFPAFQYNDQALLRGIKAIDAVSNVAGDDVGTVHVLNHFYGSAATGITSPTAHTPSKNFAGHAWLFPKK
jgi:hypothetical protein